MSDIEARIDRLEKIIDDILKKINIYVEDKKECIQVKEDISYDIFSITGDDKDSILFTIVGYEEVQEILRPIETEDLRTIVRRFFVALKKVRVRTISVHTARKYAKFIIETYNGKVEFGDQIIRFDRNMWRDVMLNNIIPLFEEKGTDNLNYFKSTMLHVIRNKCKTKTITEAKKEDNIGEWDGV